MLPPTLQSPCVYDTYSFSYENEGIYYFDNSGMAHALNPNKQLNPLLTVNYPPPFYPPQLGQWPAGTSTNGLDDDNNGVVDDANETITQPPYPVALRSIQVKIRCFEPDSHQIREITVVQDFLPK